MAAPTAPAGALPFSASERSLVQAMHAYMPASTMLRVLNDRRRADGQRRDATAEELQDEIERLGKVADDAADFAGLSAVLRDARRSGVLKVITPQVVDDFCAVFRVTPAQAAHLRDVMRHAQEGA